MNAEPGAAHAGPKHLDHLGRAVFKGYVVFRKSDGAAVYVGITVQSLRIRWGRHVEEARAGARYAISQGIRKHGPDAFEIRHVWSSLDHEGLKETEKLMIVQLGTKRPAGYNITDGGDGTLGFRITGSANPSYGKSPSEAARNKMRLKMVGRVLTPEHRAKVAAHLIGRPCPEPTKAKIGAANRGSRHTDEARAKMRAAKKGKPGRQQSAAERAKRSATMKARLAGGLSEERCRRMSAARKGKPGRQQTDAEKKKRRDTLNGMRAELSKRSLAAWAKRKAANEPPAESVIEDI